MSATKDTQDTIQDSQDSQATVAITNTNLCYGCQWNNQDPVPNHQEPCTCWEYDTDTTIQDEVQERRCQGCIEDQPNQLAHIGPNGCLGEWDY